MLFSGDHDELKAAAAAAAGGAVTRERTALMFATFFCDVLIIICVCLVLRCIYS